MMTVINSTLYIKKGRLRVEINGLRPHNQGVAKSGGLPGSVTPDAPNH